MKAAILSLVAAAALAATAGSAGAQPPRYYNPRPVIVYPSINSSPYAYPNALYPGFTTPYYGSYVPNYGLGYNSNFGPVSPYGYGNYNYNYSYNYNYTAPAPYYGGYVIPWR